MNICMVDLDGVVADNTARFEQAKFMRGYWHTLLTDKLAEALANPTNLAQVEKGLDDLLENLFWQTAFKPELVELDTLIPGAKEALQTLRYGHYDRLIFLTSRPESMRLATINWLFNQNILFYVPDGHRAVVALVMKAPAFQYTKTTIWKTGMVETLAALYGASEVLFVDDEAANTEMLMNTWNNDKISLRCCSNLEMAVKGFTEF